MNSTILLENAESCFSVKYQDKLLFLIRFGGSWFRLAWFLNQLIMTLSEKCSMKFSSVTFTIQHTC